VLDERELKNRQEEEYDQQSVQEEDEFDDPPSLRRQRGIWRMRMGEQEFIRVISRNIGS